MTEFWWGVLALPIISVALAAGVAAIFGGWLLLEKWAASRWRKLEPVKFPESIGREFELWTQGDTGLRGSFASVILAGGKVRSLRIGSAAMFLAWGKPDPKASKRINRALTKALIEVTKQEEA